LAHRDWLAAFGESRRKPGGQAFYPLSQLHVANGAGVLTVQHDQSTVERMVLGMLFE
jgi:hypothetical protein